MTYNKTLLNSIHTPLKKSQGGGAFNGKPTVKQIMQMPDKKYAPSPAVMNTKAGLAAASMISGPFSFIPGTASAVYDLGTSARYAMDGQWENAKEDLISAGLNAIPTAGVYAALAGMGKLQKAARARAAIRSAKGAMNLKDLAGSSTIRNNMTGLVQEFDKAGKEIGSIRPRSPQEVKAYNQDLIRQYRTGATPEGPTELMPFRSPEFAKGGMPCYECGGMYAEGGYYDCPDQEKDPVTGKCKAEVVRGREAAAANKAANADMNAWAKQVAAIDKANAQQDAAQYAGQLGFDYDWMQSPVDKAEKKAAMAGYKQFFQQNPNTFVPDDTSGFSPEQKYIIASKLKQKTSTPMGSKAFQQKFNQDPRFMDLGRIQSDIVPTMGGWPAVRNWMFNNKAYGGPIVDPRGQWAHPGKVTRIPSSNITMQGVPYPVLGVASSGQQVMMQPNQNYNFDNAEYVDEYPMMANGGYTVTRSNDRKGKTHKVVGPDGTVKYFGDSNLGQHPKDPERKAAFYARHKKNLDANPYFRAFARKTWKEGGETGEDKEMLEGVADILRRVNDVNNRKQLAKYMMNNFREEDVTFEPNQFLKSANAFKEGGEMIRRADGSYSRRGLWDNIRANKGSGKKPSKQMLEQERNINSMQGGGQKPAIKYKAVNPDDLPHFSQWNPKPGEKEAMAAAFQKQLEDNDKYRDNDGMLESILEFVDPTGVSSWDDVARSFRNPLGSNWDRAFNLFSAIPIVGKIGKIGKGAKAVSVAGKVATKPGVFKKVGNAALKGIDVLTGGPAMRYFDQTINPISRGFGAISGKAVQQIPYSGVRKVWGIGSDFNQMRRFQDGVISPAFNQFDNFMTQPPNNPNKK